jgi:hypothetical protein
MYVRVSATVPSSVEFYSPFFIDGTEFIGASPSDVFEVVQENEEGVLVLNKELNKIWIGSRLLWQFER